MPKAGHVSFSSHNPYPPSVMSLLLFMHIIICIKKTEAKKDEVTCLKLHSL